GWQCRAATGLAGRRKTGSLATIPAAARFISPTILRNTKNGCYRTDQGTYGRHLVGQEDGRKSRPHGRNRQDQADQTELARRAAPPLHSGVVGRPRRPARPSQQIRRRCGFALAAWSPVTG